MRILIAALGGEGGGVLMNWLVTAARNAGYEAQATSVPGVAQRTGSTSYYIEFAEPSSRTVLSLVPVPGRVDVVLSSELLETARILAAGYISPQLTTVISSSSRTFTVAEKADMGDGRFEGDTIINAVSTLAKSAVLLDLNALAEKHQTFVSATLFGALAGSGVLPWSSEACRQVLGNKPSAIASRQGFDAANHAAKSTVEAVCSTAVPDDSKQDDQHTSIRKEEFALLPTELQDILKLGQQRCMDFQDASYANLYADRCLRLSRAASNDFEASRHSLEESFRRLALWMTYEDIARVADLKTRPERFEKIRDEVKLQSGQTIIVTEYLKPRIEEIVDILPNSLGNWLMTKRQIIHRLPRLKAGLHLRSNGVVGFWLLRGAAAMRHLRRRSSRFKKESEAIEDWLHHMEFSLRHSPAFAEALAELPRVLKGYSDTYERGRSAYQKIMDAIVRPAAKTTAYNDHTALLRRAISAALANENHDQLDGLVFDGLKHSEPSNQTVSLAQTNLPC